MTAVELAAPAAASPPSAVWPGSIFGPPHRRRATRGDRQEVPITVKGGCSPNLIRVTAGVPVRLVFDRQESSGSLGFESSSS